nr:multiple epidermal growth factor-like domains protein 6 [Biomphalaria glabrata]
MYLFVKVASLVFSFLPEYETADDCGSRWFGTQCEFECHCMDNRCQTNGECETNYACKTGYFGHACQLVNIALPNLEYPELSDQNDKTCIDDSNVQNVTIELEPFPLKHFQLVFQNDTFITLISDLIIIMWPPNNTGDLRGPAVSTFCRPIPTSANVVDVHCRGTSDLVAVLLLQGDVVGLLCSVYISKGRNMALHQKVNATSVYTLYSAENAVDGNLGLDAFNAQDCYHSSTSDSRPTLTIEFNNTVYIFQFVVYNRKDLKIRLRGFSLETVSSLGFQLWKYFDTQPDQLIYYVVNSKDYLLESTKIVYLRLTNIAPGSSNPIINMCELQVFGECGDNTWELNCTKPCSQNCSILGCDSQGVCYSCKDNKYGRNCDLDRKMSNG